MNTITEIKNISMLVAKTHEGGKIHSRYQKQSPQKNITNDK